jgi:hypothetical protein
LSELKNALTKSRADQLYEPLNEFIQEDVNPTETVYIVLGAAASYSSFVIEYTVELLTSHHKEDGVIRISHDNTTAYLTSHEFNYFEAEPIPGITYGTILTGGNVSWIIVTSSVSEYLSFRYRITRVPTPVVTP